MRFVVTVTLVLPGPLLSCSTVFSEAIAQCDRQSSVAELANRSVASAALIRWLGNDHLAAS